ncbi:o-succinylbenzoate synthase [Naumannella halotolerans]|uniref:o-succinylbenzoate synthase n=1 Tax=Naumannella halotolerans TaxID=993414 RepID=UPI00370D9C30
MEHHELTWRLDMSLRFRGITTREGMLLRGRRGWGEWSPFLDYDGPELVPWLAAAHEAAEEDWPTPCRDSVPVNVTVPAVGPERAAAIVADSGCRTAKVKVAEAGQGFAEDLDRVTAVRSALGPHGAVRLDANGAWTVEQAAEAIGRLRHLDVEYVEQPCRSVTELAELRRRLARHGIDVAIAADESIRRSGDPERVAELEAADVAVLKVLPLGGVRACLELAERLGLPVVVSSALESSVGLAAGVVLAAALPRLPFACGLNTSALLIGDLVSEPLATVDGRIEVQQALVMREKVDPSLCLAGPADAERWRHRLGATSRLSRIGAGQ